MDTSLAESDPPQSEQRGEEHYSLRWNNHQSHMLSAFDALLQAETLVDVTLVCAETSVRAHKVVLSACSPFFQRIFSETPCKHPVIVLKDFRGWEVQAIVDFMYRGEISVRQERLRTLIRAGESLQVRGLVDHPAGSTTDLLNPALDREEIEEDEEESIPGSPSTNRSLAASPALLDLMPPLDFVPTLPRRKQARPRRRSGESAQDLTQTIPQQQPAQGNRSQFPNVKPDDSEPEDLCVKRTSDEREAQNAMQNQQHGMSLKDVRRPRSMKTELELAEQQLDLTLPPGAAANFAQSLMMHGGGGGPPLGPGPGMDQRDYPSPPLSLPPMGPGTGAQLGPPPRRGSPPLHFPQMPSVSALTLTPPHMFGLDSPLGLFPPGMDPGKLYSPLLDLDPRGPHGGHMDNPPYSKKKRRPKGQHSAPRGGPPRSWTNAELTEALQHVWNKKMTTSQASRIFGIPYNSLLMYVRGKYGKSLKLEQLRKDCIGGPPLELLSMSGNNNNNGGKGPKEEPGPCPRPPSSEPDALCSPGPMFNPFPPGFYPDFVGGSGFPGLPLSMLHLLPPGGGERMLHPGREPLAGLDYSIKDDDCSKRRDMEEDDYSPLALSRDERRELIQHNGQD